MRLTEVILQHFLHAGFLAVYLIEDRLSVDDVLDVTAHRTLAEAQSAVKATNAEIAKVARRHHADVEHKCYLQVTADPDVDVFVVFTLPDPWSDDDLSFLAYAPTKSELRMKVKELAEAGDIEGVDDPAEILDEIEIIEVSE